MTDRGMRYHIKRRLKSALKRLRERQSGDRWWGTNERELVGEARVLRWMLRKLGRPWR